MYSIIGKNYSWLYITYNTIIPIRIVQYKIESYISERKAWIWRKYNIQVSEKADSEELMT